MTLPPLADRVAPIARALAGANVPHAFGGALALNCYAEPRTTTDIDINIFLPETEARRILGLLHGAGVPVDEDMQSRLIERDGQTRLWWGETAVDLFFANMPFLDMAGERAVTGHLEGIPIPILSAEDIAVCKAMFNRDKDWIDLRMLVLEQQEQLDTQYILGWLDEMVGPEDTRSTDFRKLLAAVGPNSPGSANLDAFER